MNKNYIIAFLIILLGVFGFWVLVQNNNQDSPQLSLKKECREAGENIYQQEVANQSPTQTYFEPEYTYNKDLDTCLYAGGFVSVAGENTYLDRWVKDSLTNEEIVGYRAIDDIPISPEYCGDTCVSSPGEFYERKNELFQTQ